MTNQRWKAVCGDRQMGGWGVERADGSMVALYTGGREEADALAAEHNAAIQEIERLRAAAEPTAERDLFEAVKCSPVLERASTKPEGWVAEMEQDPDGEWIHLSTVLETIVKVRKGIL